MRREFERLEVAAEQKLTAEGISPTARGVCHYLDMRYIGQSHELRVELPTWPLSSDDVDLLDAAFRNVHRRAYGYANMIVLVTPSPMAVFLIPSRPER